MSRETVKKPMEESLQDKAYDLLGDMLVERNTARYMQELEEDAARGGDAEMEAFFARQDQENLKKIQAYARKQRNRRFLGHTLPRMAQVAAVIAGGRRGPGHKPGRPGAGHEAAVACGGRIYGAEPGGR